MTSRALVLGGGGVTGIAWEIAVLEHLAEHGVDLTDADRIVGTSAGSTVAAQITSGRSLRELVGAQMSDPASSPELAVELDMDTMLAIYQALADTSVRPQERCANVGAIALAADTVDEAVRHRIIEARLPSPTWPERDVIITAVDAHTGAFVTFDRGSGVPLVDAVAASCAVPGVWPPVTIGGSRYIDGGVRSPTNARLAAGFDRVLVLSPMAPAMTKQVDGEIERLRSDGADAMLVVADEQSVADMGTNPLDPAMRAASVMTARRQAAAIVDDVAAFWSP